MHACAEFNAPMAVQRIPSSLFEVSIEVPVAALIPCKDFKRLGMVSACRGFSLYVYRPEFYIYVPTHRIIPEFLGSNLQVLDLDIPRGL